MQTIGVLGGFGPQATMAFESEVHRVSQRLIPPASNRGYPGLVVWYHRNAPVVVHDDGSPIYPLRSDPALLDVARWLGQAADFLVLISNSAHVLLPDLEAACGRPTLSMITATIDEIMRLGWRRVGVLGYPDPRMPVYAEPLVQRGIVCETNDPALQPALNEAVERVNEGRNDGGSSQALLRAIDSLRARQVDGVILGCTELPFLVTSPAGPPPVINPFAILAEAAVRRAIGI